MRELGKGLARTVLGVKYSGFMSLVRRNER
jgi:hypothetical protein